MRIIIPNKFKKKCIIVKKFIIYELKIKYNLEFIFLKLYLYLIFIHFIKTINDFQLYHAVKLHK